MSRKRFVAFVLIGFMLTACGGRVSAQSAGDPEQGRLLFHQAVIGQAPGCITCHSLEPGKVIIGPSLAGVGSRAGKRIPDMLASDYLRESIMNPNGYVVAGFPAGVMYQSFGNELTEDQINNLVSYLLTLE